MPKYEYRCLNCENIFILEVSYREFNKTRKTIKCPKCKSTNYQRLITVAPPVKYNSPGFYSTDNKGKKDEE
jgi:putative FmdB family regulatory protein